MSPDPELMTGLGAAASIFFCSLGSALASVQGAKYAMRSSQRFLAFVPIIQSGVLAIYGIIVAVLLGGRIQDLSTMSEGGAYKNFAAGLSVGLACLASGLGMAGFIEDSLPTAGAAGNGEMEQPLIHKGELEQPRRYRRDPSQVRFIMCMIFLEAIGLYGLIVALVLIGK